MSLRPHTVVSGRQRWTAAAAGVAVLVLGLGLWMVRLPFVVWSAGEMSDLYASERFVVTGVETYQTTGKLQVAGVAVTRQPAGLGRILPAFYHPDEAVMPQVVSSPVGLPIPQVPMGPTTPEAQRAAEAAALRAAGLPVERAPRVVSVMVTGPSLGWLIPDDVIEMVGSTTVTSVTEFNQAVALYSVGETVALTVTRAGVRLESQIDVIARASNNELQTPSLGLVLTDSFLLGGIDVRGAPGEIGSGLILAIGVYDFVTPGGLLGDLSVAGAGSVDANGVVSGVTGASERLRAAEAAGVDVFLLPRSSCANVSLKASGMVVVAVGTLDEAISSLATLAKGWATPVPSCPA